MKEEKKSKVNVNESRILKLIEYFQPFKELDKKETENKKPQHKQNPNQNKKANQNNPNQKKKNLKKRNQTPSLRL